MKINPEQSSMPYSIVNQHFADLLGEDNILDDTFDGYNVKGIADNICFQSLKEKMQPMYFVVNDSSSYNYCFVKYAPSISSEECKVIINKELNRINYIYSNDIEIEKIIFILCIIAILITIMGLHGMIMFYLNANARYIAIRKVLGARVLDIFIVLAKKYLIVFFISYCISIPFTYIIVQKWLSNFANKINMSPGIFLVSGLILFLLISMLLYYHAKSISKLKSVNLIKS